METINNRKKVKNCKQPAIEKLRENPAEKKERRARFSKDIKSLAVYKAYLLEKIRGG